jgi:hypothetical protein
MSYHFRGPTARGYGRSLGEISSEDESALADKAKQAGVSLVEDLANGRNVDNLKNELSDLVGTILTVAVAAMGAAACGAVSGGALAPICGLGISWIMGNLPMSSLIGPAVTEFLNDLNRAGDTFDRLGKGDIGGALDNVSSIILSPVSAAEAVLNGGSAAYKSASIKAYDALTNKLQSTADAVARMERIAIGSLMKLHNEGITKLEAVGHSEWLQPSGTLPSSYSPSALAILMSKMWTFEDAKSFFEAYYISTEPGILFQQVKYIGGGSSEAMDSAVIGTPRQILPMVCSAGDRYPSDPITPHDSCHVLFQFTKAQFDERWGDNGRLGTGLVPSQWAPSGRPRDGELYFRLWNALSPHNNSKDRFSGTSQWYFHDLKERMVNIGVALKNATAAIVDCLASASTSASSVRSVYDAVAKAALVKSVYQSTAKAAQVKSVYDSKNVEIRTENANAAAAASTKTTLIVVGVLAAAGAGWWFWGRKGRR